MHTYIHNSSSENFQKIIIILNNHNYTLEETDVDRSLSESNSSSTSSGIVAVLELESLKSLLSSPSLLPPFPSVAKHLNPPKLLLETRPLEHRKQRPLPVEAIKRILCLESFPTGRQRNRKVASLKLQLVRVPIGIKLPTKKKYSEPLGI